MNVIMCILRVVSKCEGYFRDVNLREWKKSLNKLNDTGLIVKLSFILWHCTIDSIRAVYKKGILRDKFILSFVADHLIDRGMKNHTITKNLFRDYRQLIDSSSVTPQVSFMDDSDGDNAILNCQYDDCKFFSLFDSIFLLFE